jgi:hypothetical protein
MTFMFAGDNKNQWLDQVKEEFGSNLSNYKEVNIDGSGTTIELDKDAKASLAKGMKGRDYNLEGVASHSSKCTHHTNMTGKTGMTSAQSATTKKFAMDFSQQKKDLNAEQKINCAFGTTPQGDGICSGCWYGHQDPIFCTSSSPRST